jgi:hypothetical protein
VISSDEIRILARNIEVAVEIKRYVKGMIDAGIQVRVALHENTGKVVLPIFIERAFKL